jgi:hypothetical protein
MWVLHNKRWTFLSCLSSQETPSLSWNLKVHHRVYNSLPLIPILGLMNSVHTIPQQSFKIHFNIILLSMPRSSKSSLLFTFCNQNFVCISYLSHASTHLILFDLIILLTFEAPHYVQPSLTSPLLGPNIHLSTLFWNTTLSGKKLNEWYGDVKCFQMLIQTGGISCSHVLHWVKPWTTELEEQGIPIWLYCSLCKWPASLKPADWYQHHQHCCYTI